MPTGYTAAVADGTVTNLRDFALSCARGMGALIMMRDDPHDAPIPERFEPNHTFYGEKLAEAKALLAEVDALTEAECAARSVAEHEAAETYRAKYAAENATQYARYSAMIAKVEAWECKAEGLRSHMLDQLRRGRDFDCGSYRPDVPPVLPGEVWRVKTRTEAARNVERYAAEIAKEEERTAARNAWLAQLRESLIDTEQPS